MGAGLWIPFAVPSVGVLCSRAWWEASSESPWVFGDASLLHDLKRLSLFRRDEVPARNTDRLFGFAFTHRKKFLRVPRGVFSKTLLGRVWDSVPQREGKPVRQGTPFQAGQSPCTKHQQTVRLCLYAPKKVFEGSKGRFFKNAPWQGVGRRPTKREQAYMAGYAFSGGTRFLYETPTDRPALPLHTEKVFEGSKVRFFKNAPWQGVGRSPTGTGSHTEISLPTISSPEESKGCTTVRTNSSVCSGARPT